MSRPNPYDTYRRSSIETASPGRLVVLCFETAARSMKIFTEAARARRFEEAHHAAIKAQRILLELTLALDREKGGEVAAALAAAYESLRNRMVQANLKKNPEAGEALARDLDTFRGAWEEVFRRETGVAASG